MMTKKKTTRYMFVNCLLIVPAFAVVLMSFQWKQIAVQPLIIQEQNIVVSNVPDIAPVDFARVTNVVLYGDIIDPRTNQRKNHTGIDFQLNAGLDVFATADGVVVIQRYGEKQGNYIEIKHNETYSTRYYHLQSALVKKGDRIIKGQVIGLVGNTGLSAIPHLHYEIIKDYARVDPKDFLPQLPGS